VIVQSILFVLEFSTTISRRWEVKHLLMVFVLQAGNHVTVKALMKFMVV
jgi:hypothetical protein